MRVSLISKGSWQFKAVLGVIGILVAVLLILSFRYPILPNAAKFFGSILLLILLLLVYEVYREVLEYDQQNIYWRPMFSRREIVIPHSDLISLKERVGIPEYSFLRRVLKYRLLFLYRSHPVLITISIGASLIGQNRMHSFIQVVKRINPKFQM